MATAQCKRSNGKIIKYVYDLPYIERKTLCHLLDENNKWEDLGGIYMNYTVSDLRAVERAVQRDKSPTDQLLDLWGHQNHTIAELFVLLSKMQHYQAMRILAPFVDVKYHDLIHHGEANISRLHRIKKNKEANNGILSASLQALETRALEVADGMHQRTTREASDERNLNIESSNLNTEQQPKLAEKKIINSEKSPTSTPQPPHWPVANNIIQPKSISPVPQLSGTTASSVPTPVIESYGTIPQIQYDELVAATNHWDKKNILGKGGFGTVYKGLWKNTQVAIKKMEQKDTQSETGHEASIQQSLGELRFLNSYRHDNILPLYGYSLGGNAPCLLYQYMPNGSLEDRLLCRRHSLPLLWTERHDIARGIARGIQFLHTIGDTPLIHGDIKSANILLDKNLEPKIGDFGLAREGPHGQLTHMKVSRVHGTRPYLPDEYLRSKQISTKVDTFSFGIVLFEIATGQRAYEESRSVKALRDMVQDSTESDLPSIMDSKAPYENERDVIFSILIRMGKWCIRKLPRERPEVVHVLKELDELVAQTQGGRRRQNSHPHQESPRLTPSPTIQPSFNPYDFNNFLHAMGSRMTTHSPPHTFMSHQYRKQSTGSHNGEVGTGGVQFLSTASPDTFSTSPQFASYATNNSRPGHSPVLSGASSHVMGRQNSIPHDQYQYHPVLPSPEICLIPPSPYTTQHETTQSTNPFMENANNPFWANNGAVCSGMPPSPRNRFQAPRMPLPVVGSNGNEYTEPVIPQLVADLSNNENPMPTIPEASLECFFPLITELGMKETDNKQENINDDDNNPHSNQTTALSNTTENYTTNNDLTTDNYTTNDSATNSTCIKENQDVKNVSSESESKGLLYNLFTSKPSPMLFDN